MKTRIAVVDDEKNMREVLKDLLGEKGYLAETFADGESFLEYLANQTAPELVILDLKLPGKDGLKILREARAINPGLSVLMISAFATVDKAVLAMKDGAVDFLVKPFDNQRLFSAVGKALEAREMIEQAEMSKPVLSGNGALKEIIGDSAEIKSVLETIHRVAETQATVLISGESGTGKELVARAIHYLSSRRDSLMIAVNCAALPENLLESELFGFERGAFTGAYSRKPGKLELADGGTLFLDEVADLSLSAQAKLLRVIEEKEFYPLGSGAKKKIDIRLITATNRDLMDRVKRELFREDLYYRLNVIPIFLPPLRERKADIPALVDHFLEKHTKIYNTAKPVLSEETLKNLCEYAWPGNIRQLEKEVEKILILGEKDWNQERKSEQPAVAEQSSEAANGSALKSATHRAEREEIINALRSTRGNKLEAAKILNVSYKTLFNKIHRYNIRFKTDVE